MSDFLGELVNVSVTRETRAVTRVGFGIPLMLAYFSLASWGTARVRAYRDLAEMTADGFASDDPAYRMAQSAFAQENSPTQVKIGRRTRAYTQVISLVPPNPPTAAEVFTVKVDGLAATYTADGTPTRAEACIGLAAAVNALGDADAIVATGASTAGEQTLTGSTLDGVVGDDPMNPPRVLTMTFNSHADWDASTAVVTGLGPSGEAQTENFSIPNGGNATVTGTKRFSRVTQIVIPAQSGTSGTFTVGTRAPVTAASADTNSRVTLTSPAGELHSIEVTSGTLTVTDTTTDPGIASDLAEILAADGDWYGLAIDSNSAAEILATAAWVESRRKLFVAQTADTGAADATSTTDALYTLQATSYLHSPAWFYPAIATADGWLAAGILGNRLPVDPGSDNWAFKTIVGVRVLNVSTSQHNAVVAKNGNTYELVGGVGITWEGKTPQGEWIDVVRGIDWFQSRLKERVFGIQVSVEKIPFDDNGIDLIRGAVQAQITEGQRVQLFATTPKPRITTPSVTAVSESDRRNRTLPGVSFEARLAGAINKVNVRGRVVA